MEDPVRNPLVIRCTHCGGDQSFNIVKQRYACAHCGAESTLDEQKAQFRHWRALRQNIVSQEAGMMKTLACPSCGAQTIAAFDEVSTTCPFCQNTMIDANFAKTDIPEVIIPFKVTTEEAEKKLKEWTSTHKDSVAAQTIEKHLGQLSGCYLPYHIVRGACNGDMSIASQDDTIHQYPFKAYLNHSIVNASKDLSNLFLDGIEPFNFDETREFDFRYLVKQKAKIQNVETDELRQRINEETTLELHEALQQKTRSKEFDVHLHDQNVETILAALPVYIVKGENDIAAAVNGQTGKVSIATGKKKNLTERWWLPSLIGTAIVCLLGGLFWGTNGLWIGLGLGVIFLAIAHGRHHDKFIDEVLTVPKNQAPHNNTQVEFFADFGEGPVPAHLRFFYPWRVIKAILFSLVLVFLPLLIAIPIQLVRGASILDIHVGYGAVWYCFFGFIALISAGGVAKSMMYGAPLYEEILPNGKTIRRRSPLKRTSILKSIWKNYLATLHTKSGILVTLFLIALLAVSVALMLFKK